MPILQPPTLPTVISFLKLAPAFSPIATLAQKSARLQIHPGTRQWLVTSASPCDRIMNALTACPNDARRDLNVARVRRQLLQDPFTALELLPGVACPSERRKLAILIAQIWARQDINAAWNAVSRSPLSTAEKQLMFNEVWG